jgi:hypothetical protein
MTTIGHDELLHDGTHYPTSHLLAILSDTQTAEQVAKALHDAGFADVVLFNGPQALQTIEATEHKESPLRRSWERLSREISDETDSAREYLGALRQGRSVVQVYAPQREQVDQAEGILRAHGAHTIQYFGRWPITDLGG